jgi:hypothetical protein
MLFTRNKLATEFCNECNFEKIEAIFLFDYPLTILHQKYT